MWFTKFIPYWNVKITNQKSLISSSENMTAEKDQPRSAIYQTKPPQLNASAGSTVTTIATTNNNNQIVPYDRNNISRTYSGFLSAFYASLRWRQSSEDELEEVEGKLLKFIKKPFKSYFVDIGSGWGLENNRIRTIEMIPEESEILEADKKVPLVMIHGFASGIGNWLLNYDNLSENLNRRIYAFDIIGFGRSSRPKLLSKSEDVDAEFIDSIERWRKAQNIEKFILMGHSFGGYLSANYTLKHPTRVAHLILADPWGIQDKELSTNRRTFKFPILLRGVAYIFSNLAPLAILRVTGPYGPRLIHKTRNDLKEKFRPILQDESGTFVDYIYHCNVQNPSGELAFKALTIPYGWPKNPLIHNMADIDPSVGLTFIYGGRSWIETSPGESLRELLGPERVSVNIIQGSGHHVYADKFSEFNELVKEICAKVQL